MGQLVLIGGSEAIGIEFIHDKIPPDCGKMSAIPISLLILVPIVVIFGALSLREDLRFAAQVKANRNAGLYENPEFKKRYRRISAIHISIIIVLFAVTAITILSRPSALGWIVASLVLTILIIAEIKAGAVRRNLLLHEIK